jgi:hypothetical protein
MENSRQLSVVLQLVFQPCEFLHDLLPLIELLGIVALGYGAVDVVDGTGLTHVRKVVSQRVPDRGTDWCERLTMMTGHRSRADI